MQTKIELNNSDETKQLGATLGNYFKHIPLCIFVRGQLGAGKTTLIQGFIHEVLAKKSSILSPTYSYMHTYEHAPSIFHFDFYRIENPQEISELGLLDFVDDEQALRLIEWPERLGPMYGTPHLDIELKILPTTREALITPSQNFPYH